MIALLYLLHSCACVRAVHACVCAHCTREHMRAGVWVHTHASVFSTQTLTSTQCAGVLQLSCRVFLAVLRAPAAGKLRQLGWNKDQLVVQTKLRFAGLGLSRAPAIEARTLGKMNLKVSACHGANAHSALA